MNFWDWMTANQDVLQAGKDLFSPLHIVLMFVTAAWLVGGYFLFKKYPVFARKFTMGIVIFMMTSRVFRMIFRIAVGADTFWEAMPWQLCHIMCFTIGILFLTKSKRFVTPVAIFAFMGGVLTFLFGNYYAYTVLTFYDIESILLHLFLPTVSVYYLATKQLEFSFASLNQTVIFLIALVCYGEIGNTIFSFINPEINIMFIRINGLPFKIFPGSHILTYLFMATVAFLLGYSVLWCRMYKQYKQRRIEANSVPIEQVSTTESSEQPTKPVKQLTKTNAKVNAVNEKLKQTDELDKSVG